MDEGGYRAADFKDYASEGGSEVAEDEKAYVASRGDKLSATPLLVSNTQLDLMPPTLLQGLKYLTPLPLSQKCHRHFAKMSSRQTDVA